MIRILLLVAIAAVMLLFAAVPFVATHQAQAFRGGPPFPSPSAVNHACDSGHPSANHAEICTG
ncbi:MAG: hypothetical protein WA323_11890 [Candidatus Nitrosopolaris sp.]|jgi:hypothetical protein